MVYGFHIKPTNDPYVKAAQEVVEAVEGTAPGAFLVDAFPIRKSQKFSKVGLSIRLHPDQ